MKERRWHLLLGISLAVASALCYVTQILIFHRNEETFFYMLQDFAFLPVQVLLVTLVISEILRLREKSAMQKKLNMVIGAFFSEVGTHLLKLLPEFEKESDELRSLMLIKLDWTDRDFSSAMRSLRKHNPALDSRRGDLGALKQFLVENREFMLVLLENPNLLEHESFTELLWAVSHLTEELCYRNDVAGLPAADYEHLSHDIRRAYTSLLVEWLAYVKHLRDNYPYMYSLVVRTNPFDPLASAEITD